MGYSSTCPILLAFILNFLLTQSLLDIYTQYLQVSRNQSSIWEFTQCSHRISPSSESLNGIPYSFKILLWVTCLHIPSRLIPTHTNSSFWEPFVRCPESKIKLLLPKYITSHEQDKSRQGCTKLLSSLLKVIVEHVINNIPTMQSLTGISRNTQSKSDKLLLTEFAWVFRYNALEHNNPRIIFKAYTCI